MTDPPPSLLDRAHQARGALLLGCGGGGDIVQTVPVMNYLRYSGLQRFVLGDYAIKWWDKPGQVSMGCEVLPLEWFEPAERLHPTAALVSADTRVRSGLGAGSTIYEAVIADTFGVPTVSLSLLHGAQGVLAVCRWLMAHFDLDLFITVDIGADAFYSGEETTVQSPLADAISVFVAQSLGGVYALAGYGCDAEMPLAHLDRNVARAMRAGGYLGAHGLTPQDVADLDQILDRFPNEMVEQWPRDAAKGKLGTQYCKGWWPIDVSPLAAVTLFFDPAAVMGVNPLPKAVAHTTTLREAEDVILSGFNVWPETRLPLQVQAPTPPQPTA